jgi:ribose transport system substrate-binding protein
VAHPLRRGEPEFARRNSVTTGPCSSSKCPVLGGEASAACYWRKNPKFVSASFHIWPPRSEARFVWDVMMRTLEGQGPKIQSILRPVIPYTMSDVNASLKEDCDVNSTDWLEPANNGWWPASVADSYFHRPADPLTWRPAK